METLQQLLFECICLFYEVDVQNTKHIAKKSTHEYTVKTHHLCKHTVPPDFIQKCRCHSKYAEA